MPDNCATTWTNDDLAAIEGAIATGAMRVRYVDREVQYNSLAELLRARDLIRNALGCCGTDYRQMRRYGAYSKGL